MDSSLNNVNSDRTAIVAKGLSSGYGSQIVLRDIDFSLDRRAVGLLGPNGSGKTTLLRVLLGHLPAVAGSVSVNGVDMSIDPRAARRHIGWMPERGGILSGMSGVAMVAYLGELGGMPATDALQRAHETLNYVGLADERYRRAETYSQGMRQRLKLAQALVHDPSWLFLDEPTSGLDPKGRLSLLDLVLDLAGHKGFGVLLSTHLLADVKHVCSEILVLRDGRLLDHAAVGKNEGEAPEEFLVEGFGDNDAFKAGLEASGAVLGRDGRFMRVTLPRGEGGRAILAAAFNSGFALRRMQKRQETLEDLFFKLVGDDLE